MIVDIHTHKRTFTSYPAIVNIALNDVVNVLRSEINETFSTGIHPFEIAETNHETWEKLELSMADKRFVALGECGFDKNCKITTDVQLEVFKKQIILSEKFKKPVIIHCVGMFNELMAIRKELKPSQVWIIHGFRGKPELAVQLMKSGIMLSFGEKFNEKSIKVTPTNQIFIETDESGISVIDIYNKIASVKQCSINELTAGYDLLQKIT